MSEDKVDVLVGTSNNVHTVEIKLRLDRHYAVITSLSERELAYVLLGLKSLLEMANKRGRK